jgi:hypothetical protein
MGRKESQILGRWRDIWRLPHISTKDCKETIVGAIWKLLLYLQLDRMER